MVPLLQGPLINPYATVITLFMNAVGENQTDQDQISRISPRHPATQRLLQYLPRNRRPTGNNDPEVMKFIAARDIVETYDHIFDR
jgi:hypothetical protein